MALPDIVNEFSCSVFENNWFWIVSKEGALECSQLPYITLFTDLRLYPCKPPSRRWLWQKCPHFSLSKHSIFPYSGYSHSTSISFTHILLYPNPQYSKWYHLTSSDFFSTLKVKRKNIIWLHTLGRLKNTFIKQQVPWFPPVSMVFNSQLESHLWIYGLSVDNKNLDWHTQNWEPWERQSGM